MPTPWIVYSGRYTVARLRSIGFDVLSDLIDHCYDARCENQNKLPDFVWCAKTTIEKLKKIPWETVMNRCQQAAEHNQQLLKELNQQWAVDQQVFLDKLSELIK
jgi:hypothetical protein